MRRQLVTVLGSTGSIGRQALDVVRARSDRFLLFGISANENIGLLIEQAQPLEAPVCRLPPSALAGGLSGGDRRLERGERACRARFA